MTITYTAPASCATTTTQLTYINTEGTGLLTVYCTPLITLISGGATSATVPNGTYTVAISTGCLTTLTAITVDGISTTIPSNTVHYSTITFDSSHTINCISTCVH